MKAIKLITLVVVVLLSAICCRPQCNCGTAGKKSDVTIVPIDRSKEWSDQDDYYVKEFVDLRSNIDRSGLFGNGKAHHANDPYYAAGVPYGRYRIKLQSKSGSVSFGRLIDVCRKDEKVEVSGQFARVHIVPLLENLNSAELRDAKSVGDSIIMIDFHNSWDGTEMSGLFHGGVADQIPYGSYDLKFALPLGLINREVDVFQPDVWVISDSQGFYGDRVYSGPSNIVRGEVRNIPVKERPIFLTMSAVNIPYMINSVVTDTDAGNGKFSFVGVNPNSVFMLYTIGKSGVLDVREFELPRKSDIVIDLAHPNPPKIDPEP